MGSMLDNSITQYLIWSLSASDRYLSSVSSCWTDWASDLRCNIRLDSVLVWIRMSRFYYIIISPDSLIFRPFAQGKAANGVCFGCVRVFLFFSSFCTVSCTFMNSANPIIISWSLRNQLIFFFFISFWFTSGTEINCLNLTSIWTKYRIMTVV